MNLNEIAEQDLYEILNPASEISSAVNVVFTKNDEKIITGGLFGTTKIQNNIGEIDCNLNDLTVECITSEVQNVKKGFKAIINDKKYEVTRCEADNGGTKIIHLIEDE